MKHLKLPLSPLLPSITIYTNHPSSDSDTSTSTFPIRSEPLSNDTPVPISYALEMYAEILLEQGKKEEAGQVFEDLRDGVDRIRAAYWDHRLSSIGAGTGTAQV